MALVADEYRPTKEDPKERLQNELKDFWRERFAARFAEVEKTARRR